MPDRKNAKGFSYCIGTCNASENKIENLKLSVDFIKEAAKKKASLICFPEFQMAFSPINQSAKQLAELAESVNDGNFISMLGTTATTK